MGRIISGGDLIGETDDTGVSQAAPVNDGFGDGFDSGFGGGFDSGFGGGFDTEFDSTAPTFAEANVFDVKLPKVTLLAPKTAADAFRETGVVGLIPFAASIKDFAETLHMSRVSQRVADGNGSDEDKEELNNFLLDRYREGTQWYKIWQISLAIPAYAGEFYAGGKLLEAGAKGLVRSAVRKFGVTQVDDLGRALRAADKINDGSDEAVAEAQRKGAGIVAEFAARNPATKAQLGGATANIADLLLGPTATIGGKVGELKAQKEALQTLATGALKPEVAALQKEGLTKLIGETKKAVGTAAFDHLKHAAATSLPRTGIQGFRVADQIVENMAPSFRLEEDEKGRMHRILVDQGDGFVKAFKDAFLDVYIENLSEQSAEFFGLMRLFGTDRALTALKGEAVTRLITRTTNSLKKRLDLDQNQAVKFAKDILLGDGTKRGLIDQLGWQGYFPELGEELIGAGLRVATGIVEPGIPAADDLFAIGVGFLLNPLAIGTIAVSSRNEQLNKRIKPVIDSARAIGKERIRLLEEGTDVVGRTLKEGGRVIPVVVTGEDGQQVVDDMKLVLQESIARNDLKQKSPMDKISDFLLRTGSFITGGERQAIKHIDRMLTQSTNFQFDRMIAEVKKKGQVEDKDVKLFLREVMGVAVVQDSEDEALLRSSINEEGSLEGLPVYGRGQAISAPEWERLKKAYPWLIMAEPVSPEELMKDPDNFIADFSQTNGNAGVFDDIADALRNATPGTDEFKALRDRLGQMLIPPHTGMTVIQQDQYIDDRIKIIQAMISNQGLEDVLRVGLQRSTIGTAKEIRDAGLSITITKESVPFDTVLEVAGVPIPTSTAPSATPLQPGRPSVTDPVSQVAGVPIPTSAAPSATPLPPGRAPIASLVETPRYLVLEGAHVDHEPDGRQGKITPTRPCFPHRARISKTMSKV
jgi:hypothetical protein